MCLQPSEDTGDFQPTGVVRLFNDVKQGQQARDPFFLIQNEYNIA